MKKYIIIETWNGEGYSDSNAQIMEFEDSNEARMHCIKEAKEQCSYFNVNGNYVEYFIGEDSGAFSFVLLNEGVIGVVINPMINEFEVVVDEKIWDDRIEFAHLNGSIEEDDEEEWEEFMSGNIDRFYVHSGGESGDALFIRFPSDSEKEFSKDEIIKLLTDRLNACHTAMDSATDTMKENGWDDTNAYSELIGELSDNEETLTSIDRLESVKTDFVVQEMSLMGDRIKELEQGLKDCRQAMLDTQFFKEDSLQIISIDNLLNK